MSRPTCATTLLAFAATVAVAVLGAGPAQAKTAWLCLPGQASNPCAQGLSTTGFSPTGRQLAVTRPKTDKRRAIDCFYVYPTVSDQKTANANRNADTEQIEIARFQAARYSQHCRVFAPVYRQVTLQGIGGQAVPANAAKIAFGDVESAWKEYLQRYNKGRGVVLIGHSQGAGMLSNLIRRQIDGSKKARRRLVSALILGGQVMVKKGSDRGGTFKNVAACKSTTQLGCVVAFSTYNETPPANSLFGRSTGRVSSLFLKPYAKNPEVLCTNPASLKGGSALLHTVLPSREFSLKTTIGVGNLAVGFPVPKASTTYIEAKRTFRGSCSSAGGARTLQAIAQGGSPVPRPVPTAAWGLHLLDGNIALGNLVDLVGSQGRAYAKREAKR